ncbi:hypothetical protein P280DRAFT_510412 [Massarina eburnea CBS 473.64]|uniref:Integral membrane protein n=1 Tax=Massarina eburnea CBS 473.64 TaxID=1395130 RepID=A0A6A6RM50_9PLEO|nr:hypothetical protein P280DRAFT_510412 [Massarina eburnea CBS 473.64]
MATSIGDYQLAALAAGFSIGFGVLTVWEAVKQTRRNRNPLRSVYIYMIWGELGANIAIGVLGWLFLSGVIGATVPVLFFILALWVLQIQFLMQIIINRIALIAEHRKTVTKIKWGTAAVITVINISVLVIWIPAHIASPIPIFVKINNVWDKITKVLILTVDAGLNWYFLRNVNIRLVKQHRLIKYKPLVGFNAKLMVLSIAMDGMLIGLMFLRNPVVYVQFHPVTYLVKLNIEMSMASLITHVARGSPDNDMYPEAFNHGSSTDPNTKSNPRFDLQSGHQHAYIEHGRGSQSYQMGTLKGSQTDSKTHNDSIEGIHRRTDLNVVVEHIGTDEKSSTEDRRGGGSSRSSAEGIHSMFGDEFPLRQSPVQAVERHAI